MRAFGLLALLSTVAAFRFPAPADYSALLGNAQLPQLAWTKPSAEPPEAILTPASDIALSSIRSDEYHILTSPLHPKHKVRIKSTDGWCDPNAKSWTG